MIQVMLRMIQTVENCDLGDVEERPDGQAFERRSVRDFHRVFFPK
jgi:hypothetical protein